MKKILALFLAFVLVLGMGTVAFAAVIKPENVVGTGELWDGEDCNAEEVDDPVFRYALFAEYFDPEVTPPSGIATDGTVKPGDWPLLWQTVMDSKMTLHARIAQGADVIDSFVLEPDVYNHVSGEVETGVLLALHFKHAENGPHAPDGINYDITFYFEINGVKTDDFLQVTGTYFNKKGIVTPPTNSGGGSSTAVIKPENVVGERVTDLGDISAEASREFIYVLPASDFGVEGFPTVSVSDTVAPGTVKIDGFPSKATGRDSKLPWQAVKDSKMTMHARITQGSEVIESYALESRGSGSEKYACIFLEFKHPDKGPHAPDGIDFEITFYFEINGVETVDYLTVEGTYFNEKGIVTPPANSGSSSGGGSGSSGGYSSGGSGGGNSGAAGSRPAGASSNVTSGGAVSQSVAASQATMALAAAPSGTGASISVTNATVITPSAILTLAREAQKAGKELTVKADTTNAMGAVEGRLYLNPAQLTGVRGSIHLGVHTTGAAADAAKKELTGKYSNDMAVIACDQRGSYGANVQMAAKVNLSGLNTDNLKFYSYHNSRQLGQEFTEIKTDYYIDSSGFIHFSTPVGRSLIITDRPIEAK